ncbi:MAG: TolC family outer membrane protein [Acidiferrobacterales bacterium]
MSHAAPGRTRLGLRRVLWLAPLSLMLAAPLRAQAEDLAGVYHQAMESSPVIAQSRALLQADHAGHSVARAQLLPHLSAGASAGVNSTTVSGVLPQKISGSFYSDSYSVTLTQPLLDGSAYAALHAADSRVRGDRAALTYVRQALILNVTKSYFGVLRRIADARVARDQARLLESLYREAQARLKIGAGDVVAVAEARARLDAARTVVTRADDAVAVANRQLERLTHTPVPQLCDVRPFSPRGPNPDSMRQWVAMALREQPLLRQAQAQLRADRDQVDVRRRAAWPTISISGIAQHGYGVLLPDMTMNTAGASLNLAVPIFAGGAIDAGVRQAHAQVRAQQAHIADLDDGIRLDTQTAFLSLRDSVPQLTEARAARQSAVLSLKATRKGYDLGVRSILDVLTAASEAAQAQRDYERALYDQIIARVQLKAAAGILGPADVVAVNALLRPCRSP